MKKKYLDFSAILVCIISVNPLASQDEVRTIHVDARAAALGGSLVVQARDPSGLLWNPAGLSGLKGRSILLSIDRPFSFNLVSLTQFVPTLGTFGVAFSRLPSASSTVDRGTLAWGRNVLPAMAIGGRVNFDKQNDIISASVGWGLFVGNPSVGNLDNSWSGFKSERFLDRFNAGITIQNIPLNEKLVESSTLFGLSYLFPLGVLINGGYHIVRGRNTTHVGVGLGLSKHMTLMSGIERFDSRRWGAGLSYSHDNFNFILSYSREVDRLLFSLTARISPHPSKIASRYYQAARRHLKSREFKLAQAEFSKYLDFELGDARTDSARAIHDELDSRLHRIQNTIDSLFVAARKLLEQSEPQFLRAALLLSRIVEFDSTHASAQAQLSTLKPLIDDFLRKSVATGIGEYEDGNLELARDIFKRILLFNRNNALAEEYLGKIAADIKDLAEEQFYQGIGYYRQQRYQLANRALALALQYDGSLAEAASYLERTRQRIVEVEQKVGQLLQAAAELVKQQNYVRAAKLYRQALQIDRDNVPAAEQLRALKLHLDQFIVRKKREGARYYLDGNYDQAAVSMNSILAVDATDQDAKRILADIRAIKRDKISNDLALAEDHVAAGNMDLAAQLYSRVLTVEPNNTKARQGRRAAEHRIEIEALMKEGRLNLRAKNYLTARSIFGKVREKDPDNDPVLLQLNIVKDKIDKLVEQLFTKGINLYTLDRYADALDVWDEILQFDPTHKASIEYRHLTLNKIDALKKLK